MKTRKARDAGWVFLMCLAFVAITPIGIFCFGMLLPRQVPISWRLIEIIIVSFGILGGIIDLCRKGNPFVKVGLLTVLFMTWMFLIWSADLDTRLFLLGAKLRLAYSIDCKRLEVWAAALPITPPQPGSKIQMFNGVTIAPFIFENSEFYLRDDELPDDLAKCFHSSASARISYSPIRSIVVGAYGDRRGLYIRIGKQTAQESFSLPLCGDARVCVGGGG